MTHRALSRNTASSRAIPASRMRENILADPVVPVWFGANQKGMQAHQEVSDPEAARRWWLEGLEWMARHHELGEKLGIHKQIVNRVIEPWMYITAIVSATEWGNFYHLRYHKDAQPEFQHLVKLMWPVYKQSQPRVLKAGEWHTPLIHPEDEAPAREIAIERYESTQEAVSRVDEPLYNVLWDHVRESNGGRDGAIEAMKGAVLREVSVGRCARVSYLTHDGKRDLREDIALHNRLRSSADSGEPGHWSPFEHVAQALHLSDWNRYSSQSNFNNGFKQYRKLFYNENLWQLPEIPDTEDALNVQNV